MEKITQIQTQLEALQDYVKSLELDIQSTQEQLQNEEDETHITFLTDHLNMQKFELNKANAEIYVLRRKKKFAENQQTFSTS